MTFHVTKHWSDWT